VTYNSATRLKILASGKSTQAAANNRGKLFERLMADVLKQRGYEITDVVSRNYAGMEIDIEGKNITTGEPIYGECKYYSTPIDSPQIQAFAGKYAVRWKKDNHCAGLFIAIPSLNSHAMAFYQENFANDSKMILRVWQQSDVYSAIVESGLVVSTEVLQANVPEDWGKCGDRDLLYVEEGLFWVQYIIPKESAFPSHIAFFNSTGSLITDQVTIDYFTELDTELADFETITFRPSSSNRLTVIQEITESIVEVRGSSDWFEYQFPASPEFFVGRQNVLEDVDSFVEEVLNKRTSSRGILFTANSGWGKSSVVLRCAEMLKQQEHFAVVIDSRTASSSQFILRVVEYVFKKFNDFDGVIPENDGKLGITGFDGAANVLIELGRILEHHNRVLFIFLDQFEK
jgi:Restriction endonuclease